MPPKKAAGKGGKKKGGKCNQEVCWRPEGWDCVTGEPPSHEQMEAVKRGLLSLQSSFWLWQRRTALL
jgi:hypothetical protein